MTDDAAIAVGVLVEYFTGYGRQRSKISRITASRVTLENGKFFTRRKHGRPWDFAVVPPSRVAYETEHAAWLETKPGGGLHVDVTHDRRMGVSFSASGGPEAIDEVIAELGKVKEWAAREPKEPSHR